MKNTKQPIQRLIIENRVQGEKRFYRSRVQQRRYGFIWRTISVGEWHSGFDEVLGTLHSAWNKLLASHGVNIPRQQRRARARKWMGAIQR